MACGKVDPTRRDWTLVFILAAIFFAQSYSASTVKSPTWDEPYHIAPGLIMVQTGGLPHLSDHTPLLRLLSGAVLYTAGARLPATPDVDRVLHGESGNLEFSIGISLMQQQGTDWVLHWARLPLVLLNTAMVFVIFLFGRCLLGSAAGLGAALLYTFDPTIIAHSYLVTTDSGLAVLLMVFLLALWKYFERPNIVRLILCGLAFGAVLGTKYTALVLLPVGGVLAMAAALWPNRPSSGLWKTLRTYAVDLTGVILIGFLVLQAIYLFPSDPLQYSKGMSLINVAHGANPQFFMAGEVARHFYSYYAVAWLFKEPIATIILVAVGGMVLVRSKSVSRLALAFLIVPAAGIFLLYTFLSDDLCIRYILAFLPFPYLIGGLGLAALLGAAAQWKRALAGMLCLWLMVSAIGIYPDHLSYFNELACAPNKLKRIGWDGGSACGGDWLDECNIDWGQGLKQLKAARSTRTGTNRAYCLLRNVSARIIWHSKHLAGRLGRPSGSARAWALRDQRPFRGIGRQASPREQRLAQRNSTGGDRGTRVLCVRH